jgi:putative ABC transport system permease protein
MYVSLWQMPWPYVALAVRTAVDPGAVSSGIRQTLARVSPNLTPTHVETMQQIVEDQLSSDRFAMVLFGGFAAVALLLAALGIYGVMAYNVAQRSHEIGLRMALGAQRYQVVLLMVGGGMKLALAGAALGLGGVWALGRLMHSTLYSVGTVDYGSSALVTGLLLAVAVAACWVPARRSARIEPVTALREE